MQRYFESNRALWDEWTAIHRESDFYDVEAFRKGAIRLKDFELEEVGDVSGKSLLHLQCHFGLDTMSWARRGAVATGVDFSPEAVKTAEALASELGLPAKFICSNVYDLPGQLDEKFDIVYTSFGVLWWLPDLGKWAEIVTRYLRAGGFFYMAEFHPIVSTLDDADGTTEPRVRYPYFPREEPMSFPVEGSYVDRTALVKQESEYGWPHSLGEIVSSLTGAGLHLEFLHEFPFTAFKQLPFLAARPDGKWELPKDFAGEIPLMFSLRATKPRSQA